MLPVLLSALCPPAPLKSDILALYKSDYYYYYIITNDYQNLVAGLVDESAQNAAGQSSFDEQAGRVVVSVAGSQLAAPPAGQSTAPVVRHVDAVERPGRDGAHLPPAGVVAHRQQPVTAATVHRLTAVRLVVFHRQQRLTVHLRQAK